jgi:hypothetical protein
MVELCVVELPLHLVDAVDDLVGVGEANGHRNGHRYRVGAADTVADTWLSVYPCVGSMD